MAVSFVKSNQQPEMLKLWLKRSGLTTGSVEEKLTADVTLHGMHTDADRNPYFCNVRQIEVSNVHRPSGDTGYLPEHVYVENWDWPASSGGISQQFKLTIDGCIHLEAITENHTVDETEMETQQAEPVTA